MRTFFMGRQEPGKHHVLVSWGWAYYVKRDQQVTRVINATPAKGFEMVH